MRERKSTDIFAQVAVEEFHATEGQALIVLLNIDKPRLSVTSTGQVIVEGWVQNADCFRFASSQETS
jgi:hypothetical protein